MLYGKDEFIRPEIILDVRLANGHFAKRVTVFDSIILFYLHYCIHYHSSKGARTKLYLTKCSLKMLQHFLRFYWDC